MKERDVKRKLMKYTVEEPRQELVENCIRSLPDVKRQRGFFTILKLQITYMPKWIYLVSLISCTIFAMTVGNLNQTDMIYVSDTFALCLSVLLINFIILSDSVEMQEIEKSCRNSYFNILFARIILFIGFMIVFNLITNIFVFSKYHESIFYLNMIFLLPIFASLTITMVAIHLFQLRKSIHMIGMYMVISILSDMTFYKLYDFMSENYIIPIVLLFVCTVTIIILGRRMLERKFIYETYNI